jgi:hypothetical protein
MLTIPIFFGVYAKYLIIQQINFIIILIFISGLFLLFFIGRIIEVFGYNKKNIKIIEKQDVINAFINKNNKLIVWLFFPMIIIIEELVFRYYAIGILVYLLELELIIALFISSLIFSLYHIHIWFRYKNLIILLVNLGYSFLMGLYNSYLLLKLGIIPCIIFHYILVLYLYYNIYRRYFKN